MAKNVIEFDKIEIERIKNHMKSMGIKNPTMQQITEFAYLTTNTCLSMSPVRSVKNDK